MNTIEKLESLVTSAKLNHEAFYVNGNKSAGTRLRKNAMDIKNLCSEIRKEVTETKNK